jgi:hypothetical protein
VDGNGGKMKQLAVGLFGLLLASTMVEPSFGQAKQPIKEDLKDAGQATKEAGKATGRAAAKTGKKVAKGTKKVVKKTADKVEDGAEKVADKVK